jgi:hypothetical protein
MTDPLTFWLLETAAHKVHISSPHRFSSQVSFSRTKLHRRRLHSNLAHFHFPIVCYYSKRISQCPRRGRSPAGTMRYPSRTSTQPQPRSSLRQREPVLEPGPYRRPAARGRGSSRARSRDQMNTRPRSLALWSTLPCAGVRARRGTFLPERLAQASNRRWRELRGWTGRCLCASQGSRSIGLDG